MLGHQGNCLPPSILQHLRINTVPRGVCIYSWQIEVLWYLHSRYLYVITAAQNTRWAVVGGSCNSTSARSCTRRNRSATKKKHIIFLWFYSTKFYLYHTHTHSLSPSFRPSNNFSRLSMKNIAAKRTKNNSPRSVLIQNKTFEKL